MMMNVPRAIELNNQAVSQLRCKNMNQAIQLLRGALAEMKADFVQRRRPCKTHEDPLVTEETGAAALESKHNTRQQRHNVNVMSCETSSIQTLETDDETVSSTSSSSSWSQESEHDGDDDFIVHMESETTNATSLRLAPVPASTHHRCDACFVTMFDQAFYMDYPCNAGDADEDAYSSHAYGELVSAVLLYNMGLQNHSRGIERGISRDLDNALVLYTMALDILDHEPHNSCYERHLLRLALTNNMANVHAHRFAVAETAQAMANLLRLVSMDLTAAGATADASTMPMPADDCVLFYLNATLYQKDQHGMLAPAA